LKRERIKGALEILLLLGLALLQFGWVFWPWLGYLMALVNLVFIVALCAAWLVRRRAGNG